MSYDKVKQFLLTEFKLTPREYKVRFDTATKNVSETYVLFASRLSCLVFNHLREHDGWPHHEPLIAIDICLPQLSTAVQLTTLSKM